MRLPGASIAAVLLAAQGAPPPAVSKLDQIWPALTACFKPPPNSAGAQITLRFALDRGGRVIGRPRITFSHLVGPPADQRTFVAAVLGSLDRCTPLHFTGGLGDALAGRPLTIRFVGGGPAQAI